MKLLLTLLVFALAQQHRFDDSGIPVQLSRVSSRGSTVWMQLSARSDDVDQPKESRVLFVVLLGLLACMLCLLAAHTSLRLVKFSQSKYYQTRLVHLQRNYRSREYYKTLYPKFFEQL